MMSTAAPAPAKRKEAPQQSETAAAADVDENRRITLSPNPGKDADDAASDAALSPYKARFAVFEQIRQQRAAATGEDYVVAILSSPLRKLSEERLTEVLGGNDDGDVDIDLDELGQAQRAAAHDKLTQKEVDDLVRVMIVPSKLFTLNEELTQSILYADSRNSPGDGFLMLNTYSTWCSEFFLYETVIVLCLIYHVSLSLSIFSYFIR